MTAAILTLASASTTSQAIQEPSDNPVARLARDIAAGSATLEYEPGMRGYLRSLLARLRVPIESQVLVFSKTSLQHDYISPRTPRAIYFNDSVAVAAVQQGQNIELAALDRSRGLVFYTLDSRQ